MKSLKFKTFSLYFALMLPALTTLNAQEAPVNLATITQDTLLYNNPAFTPDDGKQLLRYRRFWHALIPSQLKVQYAGSIGFFSVAAGWHYGHQQRVWETDIFAGFIPAFNSSRMHVTMAAKQSYVPFRIHCTPVFDVEPLACGLFISSIFGSEFWDNEPTKYPQHYYGFSTQFRLNIFIGSRINFPLPSGNHKHSDRISLYYEFSTSELDMISKIPNGSMSLRDALSVCLGIKYDLF